MASSEVEIANRALTLLGQPPIMSFDDPGKVPAALKLNYPLSRDAVLRAYPWNSASRRASLAALTTTPAFGFSRQFQLPVDCLRVLDSEGDLQGATWRREGNLILTDEAAPLRIRYVARITDPAQLDAMLVDCIAAHLAMVTAYTITGTDSAVQRANAIYQATLKEARMIDARESSQDETVVATDWITSRISGPWW